MSGPGIAGVIARAVVGVMLVVAGIAGTGLVVHQVEVPVIGGSIHGEWDKGLVAIVLLVAGVLVIIHAFTSKKTRPDGTCINNAVPMFTRLTGQLIRGRVEAQIFIPIEVDVTRAIAYLGELEASIGQREGREVKLTLFTLYLAAIVRTVALRPQLNRFVAGPRETDYYQRNELSFSFVAKKRKDEQAKETSVKMVFSPHDTIHTVIDKLHGSVEEARSDRGNASEREMRSYKKIPFGLLSLGIRVIRWLNRHNWAPASMIKTDVLHCSAFIANMGSMKGIARQFCAPYHHLFTWGTSSLFFGIGTVQERLSRNATTGQVETRQVQQFILTYDDRISEGMYGAKAIDILTDFIEHPEKLETVPVYPAGILDELRLKPASKPAPA